MHFRSLVRALSCFLFLVIGLLGRSVAAQAPDALDEAAAQLDQKKVLAIFQIRSLDRFAQEMLTSFSKTTASSAEEKMGRQLVGGVVSAITHMDVDLGRGIVFAVQKAAFPQKRLPVSVSAWMWLKRETGLQGLMQMLPLPAGQVLSSQDGGREAYLMHPGGSRKTPSLLVVRSGLRVMLSVIPPKPRARTWMDTLTGSLAWSEKQVQMLLSSASVAPAQSLAVSKSFQDAHKRHAGSMFFFFADLQNLADLAETFSPRALPMISKFRGFLGTFDVGADLSLAKGLARLREFVTFGKRGNPVHKLFAKRYPAVDLTQVLPADADWVSSVQFDFWGAFESLQKVTSRFSSPRSARRMRREIRNSKEMFKAFVGKDLKEVVSLLNGQLSSFLRLDAKAIPFLETLAGMGFMLGVNDAAKFSAFWDDFFSKMLDKRLLLGKRIVVQGKPTIYQVQVGKEMQLYSALLGRAWVWAADLGTLQGLLAQGSQQAVWAKRLAAYPRVSASLQKGGLCAWGDGKKLPAVVARLPLPRERVGLVRQQVSRLGTFTVVNQSDASSWDTEMTLHFVAPTQDKADAAAPSALGLIRRRKVRRALRKNGPFLVGFVPAVVLPLLTSPSVAVFGLGGVGAGFFLMRSMPRRKRALRRRRRHFRRQPRFRRFERAKPSRKMPQKSEKRP